MIVRPSIDGLFTGRAAWQADNFDKLIRDAKDHVRSAEKELEGRRYQTRVDMITAIENK